MNKRSANAHPMHQTARTPARPARGALPNAFAPAPLGGLALLLALGACSSGDGSNGSGQASPGTGSTTPIGAAPSTGDPSVDPATGAPFDDGYLTFDEALALAASGQVITLPDASGEPSDGEPDPTGEPSMGGAVPPANGDTGGTSSDADVPDEAGGTAGGDDTGGDDTGGGTGDADAPATGGADTGGTTGSGSDAGTDAGSDAGDGADPAPPPTTAPQTDDVGDSTIGQTFTASTTEGFTGEVLEDGSVRVKWALDRGARGYNTYRDAEYVDTVFDTEWVDEDAHDGDFYYEIEAFDVADNFTRIATGLTVPVRGSGVPDPTPDERGTPDIDGYELVFSEEFEGDSLDLETWNTSYLWGDDLVINQEEQHYVDIENEPDFGFDPFEVANGTLTIKSVPTPPALSDAANGQPYLSGVITSYDSFQFTYGYAETRAKTPYGKGLWSAFWLLNAFYGDDDPEIDIMEHIGDDQDVVYHTYHYYDDPETLRSTESFPVPGTDYVGDFHTYAVDWRPGLLIFYVDGRETHRVSDPRVSNQDMYVILNTALGGWWPGSPDDTTEFPARYEIDYVRVYRQSAPYADPPFSDDTPSSVPMADAVPGTSPNHRPPLELFPNGYPTR